MKTFLKNDKGFTLVELMVVVAIIGVLSAVAVPQFKKYQAKSKQSEAKIQLAAAYNSEVSALADYDVYATCLTYIGYDTPPKGYYAIGFASGHLAAATTAIVNKTGTATACPNTQSVIIPSVGAISTILVADAAVAAPTVAAPQLPGSSIVAGSMSTNFLIGAAGVISSVAGTANDYDKWNINQNKDLNNVLQGF